MKIFLRLSVAVLLFFASSLHFFAEVPRVIKRNALSDPLAAFQQTLTNFVTHPRYDSALIGVKVESLDTGRVIFEHQANKLLKPASNAKMYTGALAIDRLGPDFKIRTSFYANSPIDADGHIHGDLTVYGRGDPSFSARFNNEDYNKPIEQLAAALLAAGVKEIDGDMIGDDSFFRGMPYGVGWSVDDLQQYYGAEVSALIFQENAVDLVIKPGEKIGDPVKIFCKPETTYLTFSNRTETVAKNGKRNIDLYRPVHENVVYVHGTLPLGDNYEDAVAVKDASLWFVSVLRDALTKHGVKVSGKLRAMNWLDREAAPLDFSKMTEVAFIESRPMSEIVKNMMKPSQNLFAHALLLQVAEKVRTAENKNMNSDDVGLAEMKKFLSEAGIPKGDVLLEEGSGLSRGCVLKPSASVQLLKYMRKHRYAQFYYDALPIAGVDGTLKKRFKGTFAENNLHAKTGTIRYVNSISGYVKDRADENLVFSIMSNAYNGGDGREQSDKLAAMIADLSVRTDKK